MPNTLNQIIARGSDGCFTAKENETFTMLDSFICNTANNIADRAKAVRYYDSLMGLKSHKLSDASLVKDYIATRE